MEPGARGSSPPRDASSYAQRELLPYVPRLVVEWAATSPLTRHQAIDATMVFADLSGFTAMSERLARIGRAGAEEVTDAIGGCFAELLAIAYGAGGGLLKFGGDALLLAFQGEEHVQRAVYAAATMRERLRTVGKFKTSAGNVTLRMSVGVHTGAFDCFLVGSSSRELLVTGPNASAVIAMEHGASAGQIVVSGTTAAHLPERAVGDAVGAGRLLRRAPAVELPAADEPFPSVPAHVDLRDFVPRLVHEHVLAGGGTPEHRNITVGFVHFDGLDQRVTSDGPEATADALDELVGIVQHACELHDVALLATDIDGDGGKFVLAAGAPTVHGHDDARMLATARRIVDADPMIPVRIGVHRGPVFAGDVGPPYRRTYTVMGDTVNLAARLMAAAPPGMVYASAPVVDRAPAFVVDELEPMRVKGKRAPVHAYAVGGTRGRRATAGGVAPALDLPFVGRTTELETLTKLAAEPTGVAAFIAGPGGIGKTRLIDAVSAALAGHIPIRVTCEAYESATPYATVVQLLRELLSIDDDKPLEQLRTAIVTTAPHLEPWLPLVGSLFDADAPDTPETAAIAPQYRAARVAETVADVIVARCTQPTIIAIEDDEWMDDASREVIDAIESRLELMPVLLIRTGHAAPAAGDDRVILTLGPLDRADVRTALQRATEDQPLRPHELDALADRAGGNPLFLTELWRARAHAVEDAELPDSIEALVTAQIDRLPVGLRQVLSNAAVLGRTFDVAELVRLGGESGAFDDDVWLALSEFIERDGSVAHFRHNLFRDAAYAKLAYARRRELHCRAAITIETDLGDGAESEAELLSLHFFAARAYPEAWRYARVAGLRARVQYANAPATVLLERALASARHVPDLSADAVAEVREALGDVLDRNGEYERALAQYRSARRLVRGDAVREAELLLKESWVPERIGRLADAVRAVRKGLRLVDAIEDDSAAGARARLATWYASIRQGQGRNREAIRWCDRAIVDARAAGDQAAEAHALYVRDWARLDLGEMEQIDSFDRALALYESVDDLGGQALVLNAQGAVAYWQGHWVEAVALYERSYDMSTRANAAVDAARAAANIAEVYLDQGRLEDAEARLIDAHRISRAAGYHFDAAGIRGYLGRTVARAGRCDEALMHLDDARAEFAAAEVHAWVLRVDVWRAETFQTAGDAATALALANAVLGNSTADEAVSSELALVERIRARALAQLNDATQARAALDVSLQTARSRNVEHDIARAIDVLLATPTLQQPGDDLAALTRERDEIYVRLGIAN